MASRKVKFTDIGKRVMLKKDRCTTIRQDLVDTYGYSEKEARTITEKYHPDAKVILQLNHPKEWASCKTKDDEDKFYTDWIDELADIIVESFNIPHMSHKGVALEQPVRIGY